MGIFLVIFLFGDRDIQCSYFPNDRVLYDLRGKERIFPAVIKTKMIDTGIDTADISDLFLTGEVDFSKSNTKKDSCKTYWINSDPKAPKIFSAEIRNCDSLITILDIQK